jgi:hypothetical protein
MPGKLSGSLKIYSSELCKRALMCLAYDMSSTGQVDNYIYTFKCTFQISRLADVAYDYNINVWLSVTLGVAQRSDDINAVRIYACSN